MHLIDQCITSGTSGDYIVFTVHVANINVMHTHCNITLHVELKVYL